MKYRILAFLDKITNHRLPSLCGFVWDYELCSMTPEERYGDAEYVDYDKEMFDALARNILSESPSK